LAKIDENSPVATGLKTVKIAKISHFWLKSRKKPFLRVFTRFWGFWPILGQLAQGFYINPSRRGPAPGAGRRLPEGVGEGPPSLLPEGRIASGRLAAATVF